MKPPFAYYGGKTMLAERMVQLLPPHRHYVEPFAGSLAVLLAKPRAEIETVNDLDGDLMTFWRVLRDRTGELARVCALTPHSRAEHEAAYDLDVADDLERARRVWVRLSQGRAGMLRRTGWRHFQDPAGTNSAMADYLASYVDRIMAAAARLAGVSLECKDALDLIAHYGRHAGVLIYADPPYLGSTRGWGNNYAHEMRGDDDHRALADVLRSVKADVVLSGYHSPLYEELYEGWHTTEIEASTGNGGTNRARVEVLWSNVPLGQPAEPTLFEEIA